MKNFMKELKPKSLEDVIAGISLYRPGPMDFIPKYLNGKNNTDKIEYETPELEHILEPTYGCMVYQEQVMQIVRDLAGYSYGRSDLVRRAMSKKKADVMEKERINFVNGNEEEQVKGCKNNGISEEKAMHIFDEMTDFAKYAFNKSHAAAYAVVSYRTAYLKKYFPVEFMASLLTSILDRTDKVAAYIMDCRKMGIEVLPPSINEGFGSFSTCEQGIRYGLLAIKSVGKPVIDSIVNERKNGKFTDLKDFIKRTSGKDVNKRAIENFIKAGAMDEFPGNRRQKLQVYSKLVDDINTDRKNNLTGQMSMFDFVVKDENDDNDLSAGGIVFPELEEFSKEEILAGEKEILGIYVSGHPLEEYEEMWRENVTHTTADFIPAEEGVKPLVNDNESVIVGGMITDKQIKTTRRGDLMAFVTLEDLYGSVEVIIFPKDFEKCKKYLDLDSKVFICGRVNLEEDKPGKVISSRIIPFDHLPRHLWIQFNNKKEYLENEQFIENVIWNSDGDDQVSIYLVTENAVKHMPRSKSVCADTELLVTLREKFGKDNVKLVQKKIENKA